MIENITDWFCLALLILFPVVIIWLVILNFLNRRKTKKRREIGKYYREW